MGGHITRIARNSSITNRSNKLHNLRIATQYIGEIDDIIIDDSIILLIKYFFKYNLDILCVQGFQNMNRIDQFIRDITQTSQDKNIKIYSTYTNNSNSFDDSIDATWSNSNSIVAENIDSVIISKYPIIHHAKSRSNDKWIIVANMDFHGWIVSIYTLVLTRDIANINNKDVRTAEIEHIIETVRDNSNYLKCSDTPNKLNNLGVRDIHILAGNFNINEIKNESMNDSINEEYINLFRKIRHIDAYRYVSSRRKRSTQNSSNKQKDKGTTNIFGSRTSYITVSIEDIDINKSYTLNELTKILANRTKMYIVNSAIHQIDNLNHFAVEVLFKMQV